MSELKPETDDQAEQPVTPELLARQAVWEGFLFPLHEHLHKQGISFGEHSGSAYDRYAHLPFFIDFISKQGGEKAAIQASFPQKSRRPLAAGRPTRIVSSTEQIAELLKPLRDDELRLDKAKRAAIVERATTEHRGNPTIFYGLAMYEAVDKETNFGGVTLDAVAALTLAVEKIRRQRKAS
jgi:hypothetical protein